MKLDAEKQAGARRKKRERRIIIATLVLVILLTGLQTYFSGLHRDIPISRNLLVFGLTNLNIILILLLLFLVIRNLAKLIFERRKGVLGAKLRTKLVVAFVSLSLFPGLILFFVAAGFITGSMESWFSFQVERSLEDSKKIARAYYSEAKSHATRFGLELARGISQDELYQEQKFAALKEYISVKQREYDLGVVEFFAPGRKEPLLSFHSRFIRKRFMHTRAQLIGNGLAGRQLVVVEPVRSGDLIKVVVPVPARDDPDRVAGVVVVNRAIGGNLKKKVSQIERTLEEYRQFALLKNPEKWNYLMTLLMVTLLVVFSATWFGLYLARGITNPVQKLAQGTRRVAGGDLDFTIEGDSDDELGYLVGSFNKMTRDLKASRLLLGRANEELSLSNVELESRRKNMEVILRNIAAGVIALDRAGRITTINKSAEEMLAIKNMRVLGKNYRDILTVDQLAILKDLIRELNHSKKGYVRRQVRVPLPDGTISLLVSLTSLKDERGQFQGMVVVLNDLSPLLKAQRMVAWREVARKVAHEIKNPLTPIKLSAQRLRKKFSQKLSKDGRIFEECTTTIIKQVDELKALVDEFSRFARLPQVNPQPADINQVIEEALALFKEAHKEVEFRFLPDRSIPMFDLDSDQMKRALINLLDNAVAALDGQGEVEISSQFDPGFQLVTVEVKDNGCGLPPGDRARLFEPYFSTKDSGMGLGLAIVNNIVADHNGYVKIADNQPRGTVITIELPIRTA
ncbi:MAG: ATP-binding protein [Thermodesulfobacteriota bacterium]